MPEYEDAPGHEEWQEEVEICGQKFWADPLLIPLLKALNEAGLVTTKHCAGHEEGEPAWLVIKLDNVQHFEVRGNKELKIMWNPKEAP